MLYACPRFSTGCSPGGSLTGAALPLALQDFGNVLIVDDNSSIRAALRSFLKARTPLRFCCEASNGAEAVRIARERKPAFVLMDLAMPEMNGVEAAAAIRKDLPGTKIIVFTLYPNRLGQTLAKAVGVDLVVDKEEGSAGLLKALECLLESN
ncbi:MAG TPA: response regulator transcription factor [Candidatus Acidoferrales bacterium]|nr:response regulator transcription factor [Candidatus Acidoferrales bacterium]